MVVSEPIIGRSMGVILRYWVAKWWAKNGIVTITVGKKRKWSKLCRKRLCNPEGVTRNQLEYKARWGAKCLYTLG